MELKGITKEVWKVDKVVQLAFVIMAVTLIVISYNYGRFEAATAYQKVLDNETESKFRVAILSCKFGCDKASPPSYKLESCYSKCDDAIFGVYNATKQNYETR